MMLEKISNFQIPESNKVHEEKLAADKTLEQSMKYLGCVNPILVRRNEDVPDKYEVIDGARRIRIARKIGLKELPCYLVTKKDFKPYKTDKNTENDFSDSEAEKSFDVKAEYAIWAVNLTNGKVNSATLKDIVKRLREQGLGYGAIAQRTGYSRSGIKKILNALEKENSKHQENTRPIKALITKLKNIREEIPVEQQECLKAFNIVTAYLQKKIESK